MKITGKINLLAREHLDKEGKSHINYVGSICKKRVDDYAWCNIEVVFAMEGKKAVAEKPFNKDTNYSLDVKDGFLSFRTYMNHNDKAVSVLQLVITDFDILKETAIETKAE